MSVQPDPALIDCGAIICMALQASIRQLKDVVNEIFFVAGVCVCAGSSPAHRPACVIRESRAGSGGNKRTLIFQTDHNHGYFFPPSHHLMAAAFLISTPSTLILPSSNGFLFLLIYLPLHSFHLVPLTINEPPRSTTEPLCRGTTLLLAIFFDGRLWSSPG